MTTEQVKDKLFDEFKLWMMGQAYGLGPNGEPDWYDTDVNRFVKKIRYAVRN